MSDGAATRSAVVEMKDERRAMHEGYVFLDEKCLLLAGEILRVLQHHDRLQTEFDALHGQAMAALRAAVARHGLRGLAVYPAADLAAARVTSQRRALMGVRLQDCTWVAGEAAAEAPGSAVAVEASPEAQACRTGFAALLACATALAAVCGNLERLSLEYRRSVRRARALQDVMLPELDQGIGDIESRIEEGEQEDAVWMRQGARA